MESLLTLLSEKIRQAITGQKYIDLDQIEEIRLRIGQPVEIIGAGISKMLVDRAAFTWDDSRTLLEKASDYSFYTLESELREGFITVSGGHRIGIAGRTVTEGGRVKRIQPVTSFNIRIARANIGLGEGIAPGLYEKGRWLNTLIIGQPQSGKTTLLRDIARIISTGSAEIRPGKVGLVDERSEIAGCIRGIPQQQLGPRIDILDACPKAEGMMMLIRSMSPEVIVVDEIGRAEDVQAIMEAINAGVTVIASAHAATLEQLQKRPALKRMIDQEIFERYLILKYDMAGSREQALYEAGGRHLKQTGKVWSR